MNTSKEDRDLVGAKPALVIALVVGVLLVVGGLRSPMLVFWLSSFVFVFARYLVRWVTGEQVFDASSRKRE